MIECIDVNLMLNNTASLVPPTFKLTSVLFVCVVSSTVSVGKTDSPSGLAYCRIQQELNLCHRKNIIYYLDCQSKIMGYQLGCVVYNDPPALLNTVPFQIFNLASLLSYHNGPVNSFAVLGVFVKFSNILTKFSLILSPKPE